MTSRSTTTRAPARVLQRPAPRGPRQGALDRGLAPHHRPAEEPPLTGRGPALPGTGLAGGPGRRRHAGRGTARRRTPARRRRADARRARRAGVGLPGLPAAGRVAGGGGRREAPLVRRPSRTGAGRSPAGATDAPRLLVVGLAPAAHGGNRTGRIFTGDRSGDWLFAALHRAGLAAQPTSTHAGDGQRLIGARMLAAVRCAPPGNAPTPAERDTCAPWLERELALVLPRLRCGARPRRVSPGRRSLRRWPRLGSRCRARGRGSATAREVELGGPAGLGSLPPEPAEHLHRPADRGDARRTCCTGRAPRRGAGDSARTLAGAWR